MFSFLRVGVVCASRIGSRVNNPRTHRGAVDFDRTGDADSHCLGEQEPDALVWTAIITQAWAADLADSRQDL